MKSSITFGSLALYGLLLVSCSKEKNSSITNSGELNAEKIVAQANAMPVLGCDNPIPGDLAVPEGNKLSFQAYATGFQIYQVKQSTTDPNAYSWVNIAPAASLFQKPDYTNQVGTHFGGPTWQFAKGIYKDEKVVAAKSKGVTVDPSAVPWLLLKTVDSLSSEGNKITYIQRVCTSGGLPPATPASSSNLGELDSIPYTATYLFYEGRN